MSEIINTNHAAEDKLTAAQIENDCPDKLQDLGKRITAHLAQAAKSDDKAQQHRISAGQLLAEAKKACDDSGFDAFREKYCPKLGKSRAYELLAIATNKKTVEENRAEGRERQARSRANRKTATVNSVTVTENEAAAEPQEAPTEAGEAPSIVPDQTPVPARSQSAVAQKDDAVSKFTDIVLELVRRTDKRTPDRFARTAVRVNDLANLGQFLIEVANFKRSTVTKPSSMRAHGNDVENAQSAAAISAAHQANEGKDAAASEAEPTTDDATDTENTPEDGRG